MSTPARGRRSRPSIRLPTLNLALQGGGAHGAFTWGVLDRLLEVEGLRIAGLSGASAGAMNAVALAAGWQDAGAAGARARLAELWRRVARLARFNLVPAHLAHLAVHWLAPGQLNPLGVNPLRPILLDLVDFAGLRTGKGPELLIAATHQRSGSCRVFTRAEVSVEVVLASACLPQVFPAVEIEGEPYWDGGFTSNPPLLPLVVHSGARDLLLIQINPLRNPTPPTNAGDIRNRMAEIVFGQPLAAELARLDEARRQSLFRRWLHRPDRRLARHRLHVIDGSATLARLDPQSKAEPQWSLVTRLRDHGRAAAEAWLYDWSKGRATGPAPVAQVADPVHASRRAS